MKGNPGKVKCAQAPLSPYHLPYDPIGVTDVSTIKLYSWTMK